MPTLNPSQYITVAQNATPTGDTRWNLSNDPGAQRVDATTWIGSDGVVYSGDNPSFLLGNRANVLDPNLPDWRGGTNMSGGSLLAGDAEYQQMLQNMKAQSIADKSSRDAGIKRSFINFGLSNFDLAKAAQATGIGDLAEILDPQTLELARNNQFSVQKRIERGLEDQQRSNRVSLRQRGGVRSGEAGFLAQRSQTAYDTDVYDSSQKLLDYISGAQAAYAQAEQARKMQEWQLALQAAMNYRGGGGGGGGGGAAPLAPSAPSNLAWDPDELRRVSEATGYTEGFLKRGRGGLGYDW